MSTVRRAARSITWHSLLWWARLIVAAMTAADFLYYVTAHLWHAARVDVFGVIQTVLGYIAILVCLKAPRVGILVALVPLTFMVFRGPSALEYVVLPIALSMLWASTERGIWTWVPTGAVAALLAASSVSPHVPDGAVAVDLALATVGAIIGWGSRRLLVRLRASDRRINQLRRQRERKLAQERATLVQDLQDLMRDRLRNEWEAAERVASTGSDDELRPALARLEGSARTLLGNLRLLVTALRDLPTSGEVCEISLVDAVESAEDDLVAHAFVVDLHLDEALNRVPSDAQASLRPLIGPLTDWVMRHAPAGSRLRMDVEVTSDAVVFRLTSGGRVTETGPDALVDLRPLAAAEGATLSWDATDQGSVIVASTPCQARVLAGADDPAAPVTRRGWRSRIGSSIPTVLVLILTSHFTVQLITYGTTPQAPGLACAWLSCLAALLALHRPRFAGPVAALAALASLLVASPWLLDVGVVLGWALWAALTCSRPLSRIAPLLASTLILARLGPVTIGLALFAAGTALATLLVVESTAALRRRQGRRVAVLEDQLDEVTHVMRGHLASELHDIVAHQLSRVVLTITSADAAQDPDPRALLVSLAGVLRATQVDLDLLVAVLSAKEPVASVVDAAPTLAAARVVETLEEQGYRPRAYFAPALDEVDPATQRTVLRILKEASTNILRYTPRHTECVLDVRPLGEGLRVLVTSTIGEPPNQAVAALSSGLGIAGLAQQVRLTGGTFWAGPRAGRWVVEALVPPAVDAPDSLVLT